MQSANESGASAPTKAPRLIISGDRRLQSGLRDLAASLAAWRTWGALGLIDITSRYRRTLLGPFWITISIAVQALAIGAIFSHMMNVSVYDYLPYVALGLIVWQLVSTTVKEASAAFSSVPSLVRNFPLPLGVHVLRVIWRNFLTFLHHGIFILMIVPFTGIVLGSKALLAVPGVILVMLNMGWLSFVLALASVRFRDIPPMLSNAIQMLFFVTPVIWQPSRLGDGLQFLTWNPAYHMIELIRAPLLGHVPSVTSFVVAIVFAIIGWLLAIWLYGRYHWRVSYWL